MIASSGASNNLNFPVLLAQNLPVLFFYSGGKTLELARATGPE
jgi:hypothetical protein